MLGVLHFRTFFYRYDKFRKSDKKVKSEDDDANESSDKKVPDATA